MQDDPRDALSTGAISLTLRAVFQPHRFAIMPLVSFDHVNVRTAQLDAMIAFYGEFLGLHPGKRPNFDFDGAWLYLGDHACIHLVAVADAPSPVPNATLEHFAFRAKDMADFVARLKEAGIGFSVDPVPGLPLTQINFHDPDGNHIHVDFDTSDEGR